MPAAFNASKLPVLASVAIAFAFRRGGAEIALAGLGDAARVVLIHPH